MKIFITSFILLILVSCNTKSKYRKAADEIAASSPPSKNRNVGRENYTLFVPGGWTTAHKTAYGINYYFLLAPKTMADPNTNINVITEDMQNLDLEVFRQKTIESIQERIPSATILSLGDIVANGLQGAWFSYSMRPQSIEATLVCYIYPKNGVGYIITAGTQTKDAAHYRSLFDSVAKSLKFVE